MKKYMIILFCLTTSISLFAQERGSKAMEQVETQKVAFFTRTLDLTVEESQVFWPIYNEFQEVQKKIRKDYRKNFVKLNMNDQEADAAISGYFNMEEETLQLKKQMYVKLSETIPPSKLVKLQAAENQFKQKLLERIKKRKETRRKN